MAWEKSGKAYVNKYGNVKCKIKRTKAGWSVLCSRPKGVAGYWGAAKTLKGAKAKAPGLARRASGKRRNLRLKRR